MEVVRRYAVSNIIVILLFLFLTFIIFSFFNVKKETLIYSDYYLKRENIIKSEIYHNKENIIDDFVVAYQYNDGYIGVKAIIKSEMTVVYYLIDTNINYLYGPYYDEEEYLAVEGAFESGVLSDWYFVNELN